MKTTEDEWRTKALLLAAEMRKQRRTTTAVYDRDAWKLAASLESVEEAQKEYELYYVTVNAELMIVATGMEEARQVAIKEFHSVCDGIPRDTQVSLATKEHIEDSTWDLAIPHGHNENITVQDWVAKERKEPWKS